MNDEHDPTSVAEGERRRDEGMSVAASGNGYEAWSILFETAGAQLLARGRRRITSEDILAVVGLPPGDHRKVGPIMRKLALAHNLRRVGMVKSARVSRHAGNVVVWERI